MRRHSSRLLQAAWHLHGSSHPALAAGAHASEQAATHAHHQPHQQRCKCSLASCRQMGAQAGPFAGRHPAASRQLPPSGATTQAVHPSPFRTDAFSGLTHHTGGLSGDRSLSSGISGTGRGDTAEEAGAGAGSPPADDTQPQALGSCPFGTMGSSLGQTNRVTMMFTIQPRIAMVFTCVGCDTRAVKTFSRGAYEGGVVLVRCPGCHKQHLIADHLGWFGDKGFMVEHLEAEGVRVDRFDLADAAVAAASEQLQPEDLAGWSKVQGLIQQQLGNQAGWPGVDAPAQEPERGGRMQEGDAGVAARQAAAAAVERGQRGGEDARSLRAGEVEVDGVVEVSTREARQWRKVAEQMAGRREGAG